jgi:hypothetical protein
MKANDAMFQELSTAYDLLAKQEAIIKEMGEN